MTLDKRIEDRLERIRDPHDFPSLRKLLLLIRPEYDHFTRLSYGWSEDVKQKAIDEGWEVEDLSGVSATRENIESALSRITYERPIMVMHYDHGSEFSLYGQTPGPEELVDAYTAPSVIDDRNIHMTAGMYVSAAACSSAAGLGPLAVSNRAGAYLGYSNLLWGSLGFSDLFGEAVNAPNYALLEGKSPEEAFEIGYNAWHQVYFSIYRQARQTNVLTAEAPLRRFMLDFEAAGARHNRDCFTLLMP